MPYFTINSPFLLPPVEEGLTHGYLVCEGWHGLNVDSPEKRISGSSFLDAYQGVS